MTQSGWYLIPDTKIIPTLLRENDCLSTFYNDENYYKYKQKSWIPLLDRDTAGTFMYTGI